LFNRLFFMFYATLGLLNLPPILLASERNAN